MAGVTKMDASDLVKEMEPETRRNATLAAVGSYRFMTPIGVVRFLCPKLELNQ